MSKQITEKRLYNITLAYLSRFEASAGKVRTMLNRRLAKARLAEQEIPIEAPEWIEHVIQKMKSYNYINDERYIRNQIRTLSQQGKSSRFITQKLAQEGLDFDLCQTLLEESEGTDLDRAMRYVRRKRMGLYRAPELRSERHDKDLAALARLGFSYDIACKALQTPPDKP